MTQIIVKHEYTIDPLFLGALALILIRHPDASLECSAIGNHEGITFESDADLHDFKDQADITILETVAQHFGFESPRIEEIARLTSGKAIESGDYTDLKNTATPNLEVMRPIFASTSIDISVKMLMPFFSDLSDDLGSYEEEFLDWRQSMIG